jgi:hypothetical protein
LRRRISNFRNHSPTLQMSQQVRIDETTSMVDHRSVLGRDLFFPANRNIVGVWDHENPHTML